MSDNLFKQFKINMKHNNELCELAADKVIGNKSNLEIKDNFSTYFDMIQNEVYNQYLIAQKESGQLVIDNQIKADGTVKFNDMDSFFMSIFQSRKSRAGKAFEFTIKTMFERLSYPFSEQVNIDGAKPDFVLPSEEYFLSKPLDSIIFTAKRTLRERWRQVVTEANKGYAYFLATLDEKISINQIKQASKHKIFIVVPNALKVENEVYGNEYNVLSFESFFKDYLDPAMTRWKLDGVCEPQGKFEAHQNGFEF